MFKKIFKTMDYSVLIIMFILFSIGLVALYSANGGANGDLLELRKQIIWFFVSFACLFTMVFIDYEFFGKLSIIAYVLIIISLVLVLFTKPINGASSWFNIGGASLQPGEFAKIVLIICLAKIIDYFKRKDKLNEPVSLLIILSMIAVPFVLIIKQPDYGTAMVFLVIAAVMLYAAGIKYKYIVAAVSLVAVTLPLAFFFILPEHAKNRLLVYLNPQIDPRGIGYNVIQSKLAVGSGQLWGMGLFNGNQTQLGILPMKTTDFIYSVISEEMGFIISAGIVALFVLLITKALYIAKTSQDTIGMLISVGVAGLFLAHVTENIGMTMGLLPITGIPLPFISYGGSSLLTNMVALGLLLNVSARRKRILFLT
jgi:rod shape determining protein RodA